MVQANSIDYALFIVGPTGSGKTKLAIAAAKKLNGEIISADSVAIYKELNIGSAKPNEDEKNACPHHLIDFLSPTAEYSVAEYERDALAAISDVKKRGKIPVICGGTGFYVDSVLYKRSYGNCGKNESVRAELKKTAEEKGNAYLYELLKTVDEKTALRLHENDVLRVSRALEIYYSTGKKMSETVDEGSPRFPYYAFSYDYPRELLYERINARVDAMLEAGLIAEVEGLLNGGVSPSAQSMRGIGYKEVVEGLEGGLTEQEIAETIKRNSRRFAKRQITYFKRLEGLKYLKSLAAEEAAEEIAEYIKNERPVY